VHRRRITVGLGVIALAGAALATAPFQAKASEYTSKPGCREGLQLCVEVSDPEAAFGSNYYVGHDEPAVEFYSHEEGAGYRQQYQITIPSDPTGSFSKHNGYNFELHPAFWFGVAMCDTQSYPEQTRTCTPDSDSNIVDPTKTTVAPGVAFEELQFYPPGWIRQFAGSSCDPTRWCVALNIDSLSENPLSGKTLNPTCTHEILGGTEYVNFAFLTKNGVPLGPPNPLDFDFSTSGNPQSNPSDTLFLNQGDKATVTLEDTPNGLLTTVKDQTTGETGFMQASAANHFGQIVFAPSGTNCVEKDYTFHPMYATSSPKTRVLWAAHSYNVAFSDEIGHFDFCSHINPNSPFASCDGREGIPGDREPADGDDNFCFAGDEALLYHVAGCEDTNAPGFDGTSYQHYWPNGSPTNPTPIEFSSPRTGPNFNATYAHFAFEADLPRIEAADLGGTCQRFLALPNPGANCVNPPMTDDGKPATFYPYFSTIVPSNPATSCAWGIGETLPNTINNFTGNSQEFGPLYALTYWTFGGHGATNQRYNDFNSRPQSNSC
jgi:hypothetical protein